MHCQRLAKVPQTTRVAPQSNQGCLHWRAKASINPGSSRCFREHLQAPKEKSEGFLWMTEIDAVPGSQFQRCLTFWGEASSPLPRCLPRKNQAETSARVVGVKTACAGLPEISMLSKRQQTSSGSNFPASKSYPNPDRSGICVPLGSRGRRELVVQLSTTGHC